MTASLSLPEEETAPRLACEYALQASISLSLAATTFLALSKLMGSALKAANS